MPASHAARDGYAMSLRLGCIADDTTGATDIASSLVGAGLRVQLVHGLTPGPDADTADAIVVALKSRTAPVMQAVEESLAAARWLRARGARQLVFKICSTFDSTPHGNIGPVADALRELTGASRVVVAPALPVNGRTVYQGHLFVGTDLLSDSPMRLHPLTPMTDANLVRLLQAQVGPDLAVGRLPRAVTHGGPDAVHGHLDAQAAGYVIADAIDDFDLAALARAVHGAPLLVASSGLPACLPQAWGWTARPDAAVLPRAGGRAAIVAGSCSAATQAQVAHFLQAGGAGLAIDPLRIGSVAQTVADVIAWFNAQPVERAALVYATASSEAVQRVQQALGVERAGLVVEDTMSSIARGLVAGGVRRLVVAGGETSGAVLRALGVASLRIGGPIDPGVPWCHGVAEGCGGVGVHLALKSGNFGGTDFFDRAFACLDRDCA